MAGGKPDKDSDEKLFNETVKRMLKTPPKPHQEDKHQIDHQAQKSEKKGKKPE